MWDIVCDKFHAQMNAADLYHNHTDDRLLLTEKAISQMSKEDVKLLTSIKEKVGTFVTKMAPSLRILPTVASIAVYQNE